MLKKLLLLLLLPCLLWFAGLMAYTGIVTRLEPYQGDAEGIVVLTGGDGRVETGIRLLSRGRGERLLISGVHPDVKLSELLSMYHGARDLGARIDLGFAAQDTLGNADEAAAWVQHHRLQSLIVVTAHYHMPRALVHLGSQLPDVAIYPYPVVPKLFQDRKWFLNRAALRLLVDDYNKFLLTYPQILILKQGS